METLTPLFTLRGVGVSLGGRRILDGIDLDIPKGRATFVMGRSGAGKTTLLRVLNRLNECFPGSETSGEVLLHLAHGAVRPYAGDIPLPELRRLVGMVFQHPNVLPMSIMNNIAMPLAAVRGFGRDEARDAARLALEEARLWQEVRDRLDADARSLSGGQQQRLCLARTLAMQPEVLLLDEPTSSLDSKAAEGIEELLAGLKGRYTLVVVSHGREFAARLADGVVILRDGRVDRPVVQAGPATGGNGCPEDFALEGLS
jgi:phosphate transport system ATP-binding protein